jgi:hypothetical protein
MDPKLTLTVQPTNKVVLIFSFQPGLTNRISASTNLTNWTVLATRVTGTNGTFQFEDSKDPAAAKRFYNVQLQPKP